MARALTIVALGMAAAALVVATLALRTLGRPAPLPASPAAADVAIEPSVLARLDVLDQEMRSLRSLVEGLRASLEAGEIMAVVADSDPSAKDSLPAKAFLEQYRPLIRQVIEESENERFEETVRIEVERAVQSLAGDMGHILDPSDLALLEPILFDYWRERRLSDYRLATKQRAMWPRTGPSKEDAARVGKKLDSIEQTWPPKIAEEIRRRLSSAFNR